MLYIIVHNYHQNKIWLWRIKKSIQLTAIFPQERHFLYSEVRTIYSFLKEKNKLKNAYGMYITALGPAAEEQVLY